MAEFQLVSCHINLGGDRNSVIVKDRYNAVTFPEYLLLQVIHGGEEHVHHAVSVGWEERDSATEYDRLSDLYSEGLVRTVFPGPNKALPLGNEAMMTLEEREAGERARVAAQTRARQSRSPAKPKPTPMSHQPPSIELPLGADELPAA
jgi:hypothetical protein